MVEVEGLLNNDGNRGGRGRSKTMDYELGNETGYVTDSLNSRKGSQKKIDAKSEKEEKRNRRKTKSERDKKRKGSLIPEPQNDSESETSDDAHAQNFQKYRRRPSNKRIEVDKENLLQAEGKDARRGSTPLVNIIAQGKDTRRGSTPLVNHITPKEETKEKLRSGSLRENKDEKKKEEKKEEVKVNIRQIRKRRPSRVSSFVAFNLMPDPIIDDSISNQECTNETELQLTDLTVDYTMIADENDDGESRRKHTLVDDDDQIDFVIGVDSGISSSRKPSSIMGAQSQITPASSRIQSLSTNLLDELKPEHINIQIQDLEGKQRPSSTKPSGPRRKETISIVSNGSDVIQVNNQRPDSTTTIKMDLKDIYSGTWDPKEKAVFNLVLQNLSSDKTDGKNSKKSKEKAHRSPSLKDENLFKIHECMLPEDGKGKHSSKKSFTGLRSGFKWFRNVLKRQDKHYKSSSPEYLFPKDPFLELLKQEKQKKSIFNIFRKKKNKDYNRRRAQSTNSHYPLDHILNSDYDYSITRKPLVHGSFATLNSVKEMFNKKSKSEDNLDGAFEYFANQTQVFQRTASISRKAKSRESSCEQLDRTRQLDKKLASSQSSINHVFEPLKSRSSPRTQSRGSPSIQSRGSPRIQGRGSPRIQGRGSPRIQGRGSPKIHGDERKKTKEQAVLADIKIAAKQNANQRQHLQSNNKYRRDYDSSLERTLDSHHSSITPHSVPTHSYLSSDSSPTPYSPYIQLDHIDGPRSPHYIPRGTNDSGFGAFSSASIGSSKSSSSTGKPSSLKDHSAISYRQVMAPPEIDRNSEQCITTELTINETRKDDDPYLNSFHQFRFKKQFSYML